MKGLYYSTFLLATIFISTVLTETDPCRHVQDNVFINDPSSCPGYFKCVDGKTSPHNCPNDFWFDKIKGACNYQSEVDCNQVDVKDPCKDQCKNNQSECFVNNPVSCAAYYFCQNGKAIPDECPAGTHFLNGECVYERDSGCDDNDTGATPDNVCENIPNGIFVRDSKNCVNYYRCIGNKGDQFSCSTGAYFNLKSATCDEEKDVVCDIDIDGKKPSCKGIENNHFVRDPEQCDVWYRCVGDEIDGSGKCDKPTWFDEKLQGCAWPNDVSEEMCANRCQGKQSGFVPKPEVTCKSYYYCLNEKINGDPQTCQNDLIFDDKTEHCITKPDAWTCQFEE